MKFETRAIHVGNAPDAETGAVMPPVYMTSTFAQERPGETRGYDYTRSGNPGFTRARRDPRFARRRSLCDGLRERHGRDHRGALVAPAGRCRARRGEHLRVHLPDLRAGLREVRSARRVPRLRGSGAAAVHRGAATGARLAGVAHQPDAEGARPRGDLGRRTPRRRARRRRQHLRVAVLPAADRARRDALALEYDQVHQRAFGLSGRGRGDRRRNLARPDGLRAEGRRVEPVPFRRLARRARGENARAAHGTSSCERAGARREARSLLVRPLGASSLPRLASTGRGRSTPDVRRLRHRHAVPGRRSRGRRSASYRGCVSSRWPRAWAASSRSSTIPPR